MQWLVTGASRGIGLELVRQISARGDDVIAAARDPERAPKLAALAAERKNVRIERCDVARADDRDALARALEKTNLDVLVLNAGVFGDRSSLEDVDADDVRNTLEVNAIAPLALLKALLPALRRGQKKAIVAISSGLGSIGDNTSGGYHGYRMSKAALNMAMRCAAIDLGREGFVAVAMNPGWVQTDMGGAGAPLTVDVSARNILGRVVALGPKDNGSFLDHKGGTLPW